MRVGVLGTAKITSGELAARWREAGIDATVSRRQRRSSRRQRRSRGCGQATRLSSGSTSCQRSTGVEPGLETAEVLASRGVRVVNQPEALLQAHVKLLIAHALGAAGLAHPRTLHLPPVDFDARYAAPGRYVLLDVVRALALLPASAALLQTA
jgi:glutathione synthase/RimK-type ligase-like ATP-grasp enzyme